MYLIILHTHKWRAFIVKVFIFLIRKLQTMHLNGIYCLGLSIDHNNLTIWQRVFIGIGILVKPIGMIGKFVVGFVIK